MRLEKNQFWTYSQWLFENQALLNGFLLAIALSIVGFLVSYLIALARSGPGEGFFAVAKTIGDFVRVDLPGSSLRRIWAIARLAFKEALRRKVLAVVGLFIVAIMFAGWYLDPEADQPARLYLSFVLGGTNLLVLLLGLFLSAFSLPADIKNKTIYTIVTKPVRPTEIVIGRIVGFGLIGSLILLALGLLSYLFVVRGVRHEHRVETVAQNGLSGITDKEAEHRHEFTLGADGIGVTDEQKGHRHQVTRKPGPNGQDTYEIGPPVGGLVARVPVYGSLRYTDRDGKEAEGINVGYESEYQKYIEGNTLSSAIWVFDGVSSSRFPKGLDLEMTLAAFRTYKGDIESGVQGSIVLRNPDGSAETERTQFTVREFQVDQKRIPVKMKGFKNNQPAEVDLFQDIAPNGRVEVVIRCLDQGQYLGMNVADVYLRAGEVPFWWNFAKGYISMWLQMMIVICFGVMFSTFLTGPVAMVATLSCLVLGFFGSIAGEILSGKREGGGPIESLVRIPLQLGVVSELDLGNTMVESAIRAVDRPILWFLSTVTSAMPDFRQLGTSDFVAYGVNIFGDLLGRHLTIAFGYFLLTSLIGYFFLKTREIAA